MNIQEFQKNVSRTMVDLGGNLLNSIHMVLGMCTEIDDELDDAVMNNDAVNVAEELGDCEWYIGNYANIWGFTLDTDFTYPVNDDNLDLKCSQTIGKLQDLDKKELAYGKVADITERERLVRLLLYQVESTAVLFNVDTDAMRAKIIAKLMARYPDKFDADKAINRDLNTERAILEG